MRQFLIIVCGLVLAGSVCEALHAAEDQKPVIYAWRKDGTGLVPEATPPLEWDGKKNVLWKVKVAEAPEYNYACPVIVGDRILVFSEPDVLHCLDLDGKILWSKSTTVKDLPEADQKKAIEGKFESGFAAATPATDGENAYIVLANGIVAAYEIKSGNRLWVTVIDAQPVSMEGRSAAPIISGGKLITHLTDLAAHDLKSGKVLWRQPDAQSTYGSPCAGKIGDVDVIATPGGTIVRTSDGKILAKDIGSSFYITPVIKDGHLYLIGGSFIIAKLPEKIEGDKADVKEVWADTLDGDAYCSPLIHDGLVYTCTLQGKYYVLDPKEKKKTEKQLDLVPADAGGMGGHGPMVYGSLILGGKHLFIGNTDGKMQVIEPGTEVKLVKVNELPDVSGSTPVFVGKRIYMRGSEFLYCIGEK